VRKLKTVSQKMVRAFRGVKKKQKTTNFYNLVQLFLSRKLDLNPESKLGKWREEPGHGAIWLRYMVADSKALHQFALVKAHKVVS
jgi:hypothetical protein